MRRHELKILPKWYVSVESGKKNFEIRRNDRDFKVGDTLVLQEYEEGSYTGRQITRKIQYIYQGNGDYGLSEGYCILGLEQELSGDLISREDTLTAFADYVGSGMSMDDYDALWNIVTKMPSVNPQEPCNDAISRQAVLDLPRIKTHNAWGNVIKESVDVEDVRQLPSINPQEPKIGQYEKHIDHTDCIWYGSDSGCPVTCSQYRDGWNDAMDYIFKNGKGYQPYRHDGCATGK